MGKIDDPIKRNSSWFGCHASAVENTDLVTDGMDDGDPSPVIMPTPPLASMSDPPRSIQVLLKCNGYLIIIIIIEVRQKFVKLEVRQITQRSGILWVMSE